MTESDTPTRRPLARPTPRSPVLPFAICAAVAGIAAGLFGGFVAFDRSKDLEALKTDLKEAREAADRKVADAQASMAAELEATRGDFSRKVADVESKSLEQVKQVRESAEKQIQEAREELKQTQADLKQAKDEFATQKGKGDSKPIELFNGKNLDGWVGIGGEATNWVVEKGLLVCKGGKGAKWLSTKETYGDFDLTIDFRLPKGGNSGVFIRAPHKGNPAYAGMEIQVIDDKGYSEVHKNQLKDYQHTGSIYAVVPPSKDMAREAGEWCQMRIICRGAVIRVYLNGQEIVDADMDGYEKLRPRPRRGYIGLQNHGSRLEFRNIVLREL